MLAYARPDSPVPMKPPSQAEALAEEGRRVRDEITSKRSESLLRLFDFLLERSISGHPPKEIEIAEALMSTMPTVPQGTTVRVYVHRLRKKLDLIYTGWQGARLIIPRGEYSIILSNEETEPAAASRLRPVPALRRHHVAMAVAAIVVANAAIAIGLTRHGTPSNPMAAPALLRPITASTRPKVVVVGDYYLVAEQPGGRMIRQPGIASREDLDVYLMRNPRDAGRLTDRELHYVPAGMTMALRDIASALASRQGEPAATLIPASQLTTPTIKSADIVYVGLFDGIDRLLRNALFQMSGFKVGASYDILIDKKTGRHFTSDGAVLADDRTARRDYGYIASLPGPSGNRILFVTGMREAAVLQMAALVADPDRLAAMHAQLGGATGAFEALFQVRTLGTTDLGSQLVIARRLNARGVWDRAGASQTFPNESYEVNRDRR